MRPLIATGVLVALVAAAAAIDSQAPIITFQPYGKTAPYSRTLTNGKNTRVNTSQSGQVKVDVDVTALPAVPVATAATSLAANGTNCSAGQFAAGVDQSGNAEGCATVSSVETDPQVGVLTGARWCVASDAGTEVVCNQLAPVLAESDPHLLPQSSSGLYCKGVSGEGGNYVECDYNAVEFEADPRFPQCPGGFTVHTTNDAGVWGCVEEVPPAYGHLHSEHETTDQITLTTDQVYYPWINGSCGDVYNMVCQNGYGVDAGTELANFLQVTKAGEYKATFSGSITSNHTNQRVEAELYIVRSRGDTGTVGGIEKCSTSSEFDVADENAFSFVCLVDLEIGDLVGVRFERYGGVPTVITLDHASLTLSNIAPSVAIGTMTGNYVESVATEATGGLEGGASPSQGADLSLRIKDCGQGKILKSGDGGWNCVSETDPLADLGCAADEFPKIVVTGGLGQWACSDFVNYAISSGQTNSVPLSCPTGYALTSGDAGLSCVAVVTTEADPLSIPKSMGQTNGQFPSWNGDAGVWIPKAAVLNEADPLSIHTDLGQTNGQAVAWNGDAGTWGPRTLVGSLSVGKWCVSNGTSVNCITNPPVQTESDPLSVPKSLGQVNGEVPVWNGDAGVWTADPVDPKVGSVTSGKWCKGTGSQVDCSTTDVFAGGSCSWGYATQISSTGAMTCSPIAFGAMTANKWCTATSAGTAVTCTSNAPAATGTCTSGSVVQEVTTSGVSCSVVGMAGWQCPSNSVMYGIGTNGSPLCKRLNASAFASDQTGTDPTEM